MNKVVILSAASVIVVLLAALLDLTVFGFLRDLDVVSSAKFAIRRVLLALLLSLAVTAL